MEKIIIASGPVIIENNKVLLNKHGDDNFWKFPGGKVENFDFKDWNNFLEDSANREVKEEMGIDVKIVKPLKTMLIPKPNEKESYVVLVHFLAERIGDVKPGKDIREWKWIDINNLPEDCAPNVKEIINSL
ncbi:MAG: NUDIX domain-containing protein [Patescibacteria group bacterium]|jgi:ADP-ribose pyrophosphatase YjhB (NUDIX family)